jgi:hypothetical protein
VLVGLPNILRDLVIEAMEREPDLELVGEQPDASGLEDVIGRTGARVVVAADDAVDEALAFRLVASMPVRVATLSAAVRHASVYRCRPERLDVGELTPGTLAQLLRDPD